MSAEQEVAPKLELWPITVKQAQLVVVKTHRHLKKIQGGLFAVAVVDHNSLEACKPFVRGVGIFANPARVWQGTGRGVIARVAVDGVPNACSMIYGALCRAAKALGYLEVWTYTLPEEPGTSLRAAGFEDRGLTDGGEHDRPSRRRAPAVRPDRKRRWCRRLS